MSRLADWVASLGSGLRLKERVRAILAGEAGWPWPPEMSRIWEGGALDVTWRAVRDQPAGTELALAIAAALRDPSPYVRANVIEFFSFAPEAPDNGALARALTNDAGLFAGVPDPRSGERGELREKLVHTLGARLLKGDDSLRVLLRDEALAPGRGQCVVAALLFDASGWVLQNVRAICAASPEALEPILFTVRAHGFDGRGIVAAVRDVVPEATLRAAIEGVYPAGRERRRLVAVAVRR